MWQDGFKDISTGALYPQDGWDLLLLAPSPNVATLVPSPLLRVALPSTTGATEQAGNSTAVTWLNADDPFSLQMNFRYEQPPSAATYPDGRLSVYEQTDPWSFIEIDVTVNRETADDQANLSLAVWDGVNYDSIFLEKHAITALTWHSLYLTRDTSDWLLYLDNVLVGSTPITASFSGVVWTSTVQFQTNLIAYRVQTRYVNVAQPPIAPIAAASSGPA